jgi:hypothetical protein
VLKTKDYDLLNKRIEKIKLLESKVRCEKCYILRKNKDIIKELICKECYVNGK